MHDLLVIMMILLVIIAVILTNLFSIPVSYCFPKSIMNGSSITNFIMMIIFQRINNRKEKLDEKEGEFNRLVVYQ